MITLETNSPELLDYIASIMTREEILADQKFCHLLEDPTTKENMEIALACQAAKTGGYAEKKEFVQYLLCNGPELDAPTILYYRQIILDNPDLYKIANVEFMDINVIDNLRRTVYNKKTAADDGNCFMNPCNYLGNLSATMGIMGDSENALTISNIFAKKFKKTKKVKKADGTVVEEEDEITPWGMIRRDVINKLTPNVTNAVRMIQRQVYLSVDDFGKELKKLGYEKQLTLGDPQAIELAEETASSVKVNLFQRLGDCARLWQHMRRLNKYEPVMNKKAPIAGNVNGVRPDGAEVPNYTPRTEADAATPSVKARHNA